MKPPFFLSSVSIENFKAVCKSGTVKLTPLTVFIGNNGSGKSSLLEGLETYQETVSRGPDAAIARWLGFEYVWNKRARHNQKHVRTEDGTYKNPMVFVLKGRVFRGSFGCVPPFTHSVFNRAMRLMRPTVLRAPPGCNVQAAF